MLRSSINERLGVGTNEIPDEPLSPEFCLKGIERIHMADEDTLVALTYMIETPRGDVTLQISRPDTLQEVFAGIAERTADPYDAFFIMWENRDPESTTDLPGGTYRLRLVNSRWVAVADDWMKPLRANLEYPETLDAEDVAHMTDVARFKESEVHIESLDYGRGIVTPKVALADEAEGAIHRFYLRRCRRQPYGEYLNEASALRRIRHSHIISLAGFLVDADGRVVGLLTLYAARGNLSAQSHTDDVQKLRWILQVIDALIYLVDNGFTYYAINCEDVVVDDTNNAFLVNFDASSILRYEDLSHSYSLGTMLEELSCHGRDILDFIIRCKSDDLSLVDCQTQVASLLTSACAAAMHHGAWAEITP